jgi:hypothetical protein
MIRRGKKFVFHGSFTDKARAIRKEKSVDGFIRSVQVKGHRRYLVLTRRRKR